MGIPRVASESSLRELATPLPGEIPLSQSCIVVPSRSTSEQARASTAMTAEGFISRHTAFISSAVSIPVCPKTPPARQLTGRSEVRNFSSSYSSSFLRWRVASTFSAAHGPIASGVISRFPRPATRISPDGRKVFSSSASSSAISS